MNAFVKTEETQTDLEKLAMAWAVAKGAEQTANTQRLEIEAQIANMVGVKDEGVITQETSFFKIKTTGKVTRTVDSEALGDHWDQLPDEITKCFNWKAAVDTKNLRALESMRDDLVPVLAQYITTKPAKASISVEPK